MLPLPVSICDCGPRSCARMLPDPVCNFAGRATPSTEISPDPVLTDSAVSGGRVISYEIATWRLASSGRLYPIRIELPFCSIGGFDSTLFTALSALPPHQSLLVHPAVNHDLIGAARLDHHRT